MVDGGLAPEEASLLATLLIAATESAADAGLRSVDALVRRGGAQLGGTRLDRALFASVAASLMRQVDDVMRR